jgi:hypothetical protein
MFVVYLPAMHGKLQGWLRNTIWTTYPDRATQFATREDAQFAMGRAAEFHLKRTMRAARIIEVVEVQS